ncbi:MAG: hypothetical protein KAF91_31150 [Nostoc sp. TH1S01]|nr:hypothetical protein [Nostoc sp. TH1S01]
MIANSQKLKAARDCGQNLPNRIMPGNTKLQNSQCNWTEQHDAFCLANKISPAKIFNYSLDDVLAAIGVYKIRSAAEQIFNPPGWLIECLQWRYWEDITAWGGGL